MGLLSLTIQVEVMGQKPAERNFFKYTWHVCVSSDPVLVNGMDDLICEAFVSMYTGLEKPKRIILTLSYI